MVGIGLASMVALAVIVLAARTWLRKPVVPVGPDGKTSDAAAPSLEGVSRVELDRLEDELDNLEEA